MRRLLEYGADTEVADDLSGNTPLHTAAKHGRTDIAALLLEGGADPDSRARQGETPLHVAVGEANSLDMVRLLLEHGADPNAETHWGKLPLEYAADPEIKETLEAVTTKKEVARSTPEELIERLLDVPALLGEMPVGCSDTEISSLEETFGITLPEAYKLFLCIMGRGPRYPFECNHWEVFYPDLLRMGRGAQYEKWCPALPSDYFVFASRLSANLFFIADGTDDDPPIYSLEGETIEREYDSFWDFFKEIVVLNEVYGG